GDPILDVVLLYGSDSVPEGYAKIQRTAGGKKANLNSGVMGQYLYLAVRPLLAMPGGGSGRGLPPWSWQSQ
ncbi:unnamed protein product, partial [Discosporangium mesarthrocarpum]